MPLHEDTSRIISLIEMLQLREGALRIEALLFKMHSLKMVRPSLLPTQCPEVYVYEVHRKKANGLREAWMIIKLDNEHSDKRPGVLWGWNVCVLVLVLERIVELELMRFRERPELPPFMLTPSGGCSDARPRRGWCWSKR